MEIRGEAVQLKLLLPTRIEVDKPVLKIIAEAGDGYFCLLPKHIDFVASLSQGILMFVDSDGHDCFYAIDGGVLVKNGSTVRVSSTDAFPGPDMESLQQKLQDYFEDQEDHDRLLRSALTRLEMATIRRLRNWRKQV